MPGFYLCFLLLLSSFDLGCGKVLSGKINSSDNWVSVSQFYLIGETEHLDYNVEYAATNQCCPSLAYYFEDSWESVYNKSTMDCQSKINRAKAVFAFQNTPGSNKSIPDNFSIYSASQTMLLIFGNAPEHFGSLRKTINGGSSL